MDKTQGHQHTHNTAALGPAVLGTQHDQEQPRHEPHVIPADRQQMRQAQLLEGFLDLGSHGFFVAGKNAQQQSGFILFKALGQVIAPTPPHGLDARINGWQSYSVSPSDDVPLGCHVRMSQVRAKIKGGGPIRRFDAAQLHQGPTPPSLCLMDVCIQPKAKVFSSGVDPRPQSTLGRRAGKGQVAGKKCRTNQGPFGHRTADGCASFSVLHSDAELSQPPS